MPATTDGPVIGLDFGTTNSVAARAMPGGEAGMVDFAGPDGATQIFRSALCFWQEGRGLSHAAGPWAIAEYLEYPQDSRFLQSFKSVAASASFDTASVFDKRYRFEDLGRMFLDGLADRSDGAFAGPPARIVVGRPVEYAGSRPDAELARRRYDAMFRDLGTEVHYVFEPLGAAFGHASTLTRPATLLVADFGGGTSDFSVVRVAEPGAARRCTALGHAGIGIAGDRFDFRILDRLVLPMLGKGGMYRSFDKLLEIPRSYFTDFADWSRLALMRNRRTLDELRRLQRTAVDGAAIGRMIAVIDNELGFPLYDAVARLKRALSHDTRAHFSFSGAGLDIEADVERSTFQAWIAEDVARMEATLDRALAAAGTPDGAIDRVFLTGGTSLTPMVRDLFVRRFGEDAIMTGGELTSIAHGLALIAQEPDISVWIA